jgi:hypothetical protein
MVKTKRGLWVIAELVRSAGWAPTLVFLLHVFISRVLKAYILFPPLDIPMHFVGGVAIAYFWLRCCAAVPPDAIGARYRRALQALIVASLTVSSTVLWEFGEFISDRVFGTHAQLGLEDTLLDMALGFAGGLCYLAVALRVGRLGQYIPIPRASPIEIS